MNYIYNFFNTLFPTPPSPPPPHYLYDYLWPTKPPSAVQNLDIKTHVWENSALYAAAVSAAIVWAIICLRRNSQQVISSSIEDSLYTPVSRSGASSALSNNPKTPVNSDQQTKAGPVTTTSSPSSSSSSPSSSSTTIIKAEDKPKIVTTKPSTPTTSNSQIVAKPSANDKTQAVVKSSLPASVATNQSRQSVNENEKTDRVSPKVTATYSINMMKLEIELPYTKQLPPTNISLVFCVDTSTSMNLTADGEVEEVIDPRKIIKHLGDGLVLVREENEKPKKGLTRAEAVKKGMKDVIDRAQKQINSERGASIRVSIVTFDDNPKVICEPKHLLRTNNALSDEIQENIEKINSDGGTRMDLGLEWALNKIKTMHKADQNKDTKHILILLTDGQNTHLYDDEIPEIRKQLLTYNASLYAIGIGKEHDPKILNQLVNKNHADNFKGFYINAGNDPAKIPGALCTIFERAIASYTFKLVCTTKEAAGHWRVGRDRVEVGENEYDLEPLVRGKMERYIKVRSRYLQQPLDLASLVFKLNYSDPDGKKGSVPLPWKVTSVLNPEIAKETKKRH